MLEVGFVLLVICLGPGGMSISFFWFAGFPFRSEIKWQWTFSAVDNARIVLDLIIKVFKEWELDGVRCCSALEVGFPSRKSRMSCAFPCLPVKIFSL